MLTLRNVFRFFFVLFPLLLFSQAGKVLIKTDTAVVVANGEMRSLMVQISNGTATAKNLKLSIKAPEGVRLLNPGTTVNSEAGENLFIPVKIFIEKKLPAGNSPVSLWLQDAAGKIVASCETVLKVEARRQLRIFSDEPQILIYRVGDSLNISTQVSNGGNRTEEAEIYASFPQGIGNELILRKKVILAPFSSQKVEFSRIIDREMLRMEVFTVNVAVTDASKEFFGNTMVTVQNALGNRRYVDPAQNPFYRGIENNYISWSSNNPFDQISASHMLNLHSTVNIGNTKAIVNMNGTFWPTLDTKMMFQNTWLKLEHNEFSMHLGNINDNNMEITLNGRGSQLTFTPSPETGTAISAGVVEKSFNLFEPVRVNNFPRGYSAFARANYALNGYQSLDGEAIWDTDIFQRSFILKTGYTYSNKKDKSFDVDLGYGYARSVSHSDVAEPSLSAGLNYRKNWKNYSFTSSNSYSSGYYPGIRRGSTVLEQRLFRSFDKFTLYGAYGLNHYNPKNIDPLYQFSSFSERHRIELGSSFRYSRKMDISLLSQTSTENSEVFLGEVFARTAIKFESATAGITLNYATDDQKNRFTLSHTQGISYYRGITEPSHIYNLQAGWHHRNLLISGNYQKGNFLLYEGNRNGKISDGNERLSAVASYRSVLLNNKLNLNFNAMANLDRQSGKSLALSSNADYRIFRTTRIFGSFSYSYYSSGAHGNKNIFYQAGISQDLPTIGDEPVKYKNGTIRMFTFFDHNNNGTYDPGIDQPANGVKVRINNILFMAAEDGYVKYRKLPFGKYVIKSNENEWYSEIQEVDLQQKEEFITLPLVKTGVLKGKITYEKTGKFQYEVQEHLAGIPVLFRSTTGKTFTFYSNALGEYSAYLPLGRYQVSLESQAFQKNVYTESSFNDVIVEASTTKSLEDFLLKVREKKVEIKRFGTAE
ncbi:hypothetical protein F7R58_02330 [Chryseobacterium sp.]|nr:hypothetical protein F7R58_02330 [Chryseobacterium sp.]